MNSKTIEDIRGLVRPILTIIFGVAFIFGVFARLVDPIWLVYLTVGIFVFWFGDRAFKNLGFIIKGELPVATPPTNGNGEAKPQSQPEPSQPTPAQPAPLPEEKPQPVEPVPVFDAAAFHEVVLKDVGPKYTEVNPCTIFYEARDKGLVTRVDHINQALDYWDYLIDLAQDGFQHIWGYTLEEAIAKVNETGCPTCPTCPGSRDIDSKARQAGMPFYAILLELRRTMRKRQDIYQLAQSGIDWKSRISTQHQTLYGLGELAEELMRTG